MAGCGEEIAVEIAASGAPGTCAIRPEKVSYEEADSSDKDK
jgi:hypothetical protein